MNDEDFSVHAIASYDTDNTNTSQYTQKDAIVNISNCSYSIIIPTHIKMNFIDFAKNTKNCIVNDNRPWRCIYHEKDMTVTMSGMNAWMVSTRVMDEHVIRDRIRKIYGFEPDEIRISNMTFSVNTQQTLDIYEIYRRRNENKTPWTVIKSFHLDEQQFPALRVHMTNPKNIALEVYSSGRIVATGIKCKQDLETILLFIKENVY